MPYTDPEKSRRVTRAPQLHNWFIDLFELCTRWAVGLRRRELLRGRWVRVGPMNYANVNKGLNGGKSISLRRSAKAIRNFDTTDTIARFTNCTGRATEGVVRKAADSLTRRGTDTTVLYTHIYVPNSLVQLIAQTPLQRSL